MVSYASSNRTLIKYASILVNLEALFGQRLGPIGKRMNDTNMKFR